MDLRTWNRDTRQCCYATQRCFTQSCAKVAGQVNDIGAGKIDPATLTCD